MSVSYTTYLFYGFKLSPKLFDWDNPVHEACVNGAKTAPFDIVYDGMSGEYMFVGEIIASSDSYGNGFEVLDLTEKLKEIDPVSFSPKWTKIAEMFPDDVGSNPRLYLFTHAS